MLKAISLLEKETLQIPGDNIIEDETSPENRIETSSNDESDIDEIR